MCSVVIKNRNGEVFKKTNSTRARCNTKPKQRVDGIPPSTKFANLITADHKIPNVRNESRCGQRNALIVQNEFTNRIQSDPMETKDTSGTFSCLRRFLAPLRRPEHIYTDTSKEII